MTPLKTALLSLFLVPLGADAQAGAVFKCPGNLYTDAMSPREAQVRGCRMLDGSAITVIPAAPARAVAPRAPTSPGAAPHRSGDTVVSAAEQRVRDADARAILEAELRREEDRLAALRTEFNNGEPERRGDEARNHQKYLDRVAELKASIQRKESDLAAIRRELAKLQ